MRKRFTSLLVLLVSFMLTIPVLAEQSVELIDYTYNFPQALNGWTTIDADGDGNTWNLLIDKNNSGYNGDPGMMQSASYLSSALTPDNYLVSPKMKLDGKITFWACAQDKSYPSEHFGVAVSTAGNTDAADFTMVSPEWEMTAAPARITPRKVQGQWYEYEVDLSGYEGAEGYVAIRHYNCTDWFRLNVDNITLSTSELLDAYDPELEVLPEPATPVVLPEGAEVAEYSMSYKNSSNETLNKPIYVAVVGNEVYFQGMSQYLPEAWVKGTLDGNTVTFDSNQLMGTYGTYGESYFFYTGSVNTFIYDAEADTYTATGQVFGVLGNRYDGRYFDPVLSKVTEKAATPGTPTITAITGTNWGDVVEFYIPTVDINDDALVTSKLSYQFFIDDESTPLEFTTNYFTKLTANMTVIPYGFTENYDFYPTYIYLNMPHDTWKKIGIQSIYTGGGEENKSEIFWFTMPVGPVVAPEGLVTEDYSFEATARDYNQGDEEVPYDHNSIVKVGFDGDDVYIQGLSKDAPDLWVKATKNSDGKYVIPANQYMGKLTIAQYTFPYYWTAIDDENNLVDVVLDFNTETSTFTTDQTVALNGSADALEYYILYNNVVITKFIDVAAKPANPTVEAFNISDQVGYSTIYASIPTVDINDNTLNTGKLFYIVWIEKNGTQQKYTFTKDLYSSDFDEDVTEVPYTHDGYDIYLGGEIIYLEDELDELNSWTKVGMQSVYYGGGERNESDIVWLDVTGIQEIDATTDNAAATIYNLQGQKVNKAEKGIYIINGRKVLVK